MARTALQLSTEASSRARDPNQTGTPQPVVIQQILSRAQVVLNCATESVLQTVAMPMQARRQVYSIDGDLRAACEAINLPLPAKVVDVRDGTRSLSHISDFHRLRHISPWWFRSVADKPQSWCNFGHDTFVIRPALKWDSTINVIYCVQTLDLSVPTDVTQIPDEDCDTLLDLTEAILRLKGRDFDADYEGLMKRLAERVKTLQTVTR